LARLLGIARRAAKRAPMETLDTVTIGTVDGVAGDLRGKPGRRQVTVLAREAWDAACAELGTTLPWTTRRANLLVEGLDLAATTGTRLTIGAVVLEVTGETDPCHRMDEQKAGLRAALTPDWRGGITCRVVRGGTLSVGDPAHLEPRGHQD
jgi:MOSC domain-containing protein YiiM